MLDAARPLTVSCASSNPYSWEGLKQRTWHITSGVATSETCVILSTARRMPLPLHLQYLLKQNCVWLRVGGGGGGGYTKIRLHCTEVGDQQSLSFTSSQQHLFSTDRLKMFFVCFFPDSRSPYHDRLPSGEQFLIVSIFREIKHRRYSFRGNIHVYMAIVSMACDSADRKVLMS